jgi:hypothetical protein
VATMDRISSEQPYAPDVKSYGHKSGHLQNFVHKPDIYTITPVNGSTGNSAICIPNGTASLP